MLTLILDIDGTITNMWPIERAILLAMAPMANSKEIDLLKNNNINDLFFIYTKISSSKTQKSTFIKLYRDTFVILSNKNSLPVPVEYKIVDFIRKNASLYNYVYATGGLRAEAEYILDSFDIKHLFDLETSVSRDTCVYSKKTGKPFMQILKKYNHCFFVTDSQSDLIGAKKANMPTRLLKPNETIKYSDIL